MSALEGPALEARGNGRTALGVALSTGHAGLAAYLIEQGAELGVVDERSGLTPVLYATAQGDLALLKRSLEKGAPVDRAFRNGESALHIAVAEGDVAAVQLLLSCEADPNRANSSGDTPLHGAVRGGEVAIVASLVAAGADQSLLNRRGQRPAELARTGISFADALAPRED